jgi:hypothetical protein
MLAARPIRRLIGPSKQNVKLGSKELALHVATIALAFGSFGLRFRAAIGSERSGDVDDVIELALFVSADVAAVAFVRFNKGPFAGFGGFSWHN